MQAHGMSLGAGTIGGSHRRAPVPAAPCLISSLS